jgi:hypothetical protein
VSKDTVRGPLQPPYDGPYKVIQRNEKYFTITVNNKNVTVSIDRIKPAFMVSENIEQQPQCEDSAENSGEREHSEMNNEQGYTTRAGRNVRLPDRFRAG